MHYPLTRLEGDEELTYTVELDYELECGAHASTWGVASGERMASWPVIIGAWMDGKVFALTDDEIAAAEDWIAGRL